MTRLYDETTGLPYTTRGDYRYYDFSKCDDPKKCQEIADEYSCEAKFWKTATIVTCLASGVISYLGLSHSDFKNCALAALSLRPTSVCANPDEPLLVVAMYLVFPVLGIFMAYAGWDKNKHLNQQMNLTRQHHITHMDSN